MPLINVFTSAELPHAETCDELLMELSEMLARHFGKPEAYVMTSLSPRPRMTFGGSVAPSCYVEIKNIGKMTPAESSALSAEICARLTAVLDVPGSRIYIEMADIEPHLWGFDGSTFA
jgi:phenylpyruvate tautomerase PptA (4-oxalocrotonate tautomerase family)